MNVTVKERKKFAQQNNEKMKTIEHEMLKIYVRMYACVMFKLQ